MWSSEICHSSVGSATLLTSDGSLTSLKDYQVALLKISSVCFATLAGN